MERSGTRGGVISIRFRPGGAEEFHVSSLSIEHVFLVELGAVGAQNAQEFGFEVFGFVMPGLPSDVPLQRVLSGFADGEKAASSGNVSRIHLLDPAFTVRIKSDSLPSGRHRR